jgi:hypothetical protein
MVYVSSEAMHIPFALIPQHRTERIGRERPHEPVVESTICVIVLSVAGRKVEPTRSSCVHTTFRQPELDRALQSCTIDGKTQVQSMHNQVILRTPPTAARIRPTGEVLDRYSNIAFPVYQHTAENPATVPFSPGTTLFHSGSGTQPGAGSMPCI